MSVQFGRWNFEGQLPARDYVEKVSATLAPYALDSQATYSKGGVEIIYGAFHTTKESRREMQPHISPSGAVITWDGRLDNRAEIITELSDVLTISSTDVEIVAAAYEKRGTNCFGRLIGDWALSIWNPNSHLLILAKDPIGTRHLYYSIDDNHVTWSTILDPLVLFADKTFAVCEEYVAGWLSYVPAVHLTPYDGINSVPPSSSVLLRPGKRAVNKYWDFDPDKKIRYRTDAEYEEHFRSVFALSVKRRLRSDRPVLGELSGGMDSSSIVCMADMIMARGEAEAPRLDTMSWYDDTDPDWKEERLYFTKVEAKRCRTGHWIDLGLREEIGKKGRNSRKAFLFRIERDRLAITPDSNLNPWPKFSAQYFERYLACLNSQGYRVTLSGIGGEEPTGGFVPTPRPELQNLLARGRLFALAHQLHAWAAKMRKPCFRLLSEAIRGFLAHSVFVNGNPKYLQPAPWLHPRFVRQNRAALFGYPSRVKLFGPLPSFQMHIHGLDHLRMVLARFGLLRFYTEIPREVRYPYLDRDLLEFAYAVPQEQVVGVGRRRFLMKRALSGIVPDELLNRKPRAAVAREPKRDTIVQWPSLEMQQCISSSIGIIDPNRFGDWLQKAKRKEEVPVDGLYRTVLLEFWLRQLTTKGVLTNKMVTKRSSVLHLLKLRDSMRLFNQKSSVS